MRTLDLKALDRTGVAWILPLGALTLVLMLAAVHSWLERF